MFMLARHTGRNWALLGGNALFVTSMQNVRKSRVNSAPPPPFPPNKGFVFEGFAVRADLDKNPLVLLIKMREQVTPGTEKH
jgi:hypothetical protein